MILPRPEADQSFIEKLEAVMAQRSTDLHTVLRLAVALALGGVCWAAGKTAALAVLSPESFTYRAAVASGWPATVILLCALAAVLPLPRLVSAIATPHWEFDRAAAKVAVFGAWFGAVAKMLIAYGSLPLGDTWVTLQYTGDALLSLLGGFLIAIVLNTDLKWERRA